MGTIQNSVNQLIGTVTAGIGVGRHVAEQSKQTEAITKQKDLAQQQWDELNKPDYGKNLTNAQAERKAIGALLNARYPGWQLKNFDPASRLNPQGQADYKAVKESYELAKDKELEAAKNYNYPAGKKMATELTEEVEDNGK